MDYSYQYNPVEDSFNLVGGQSTLAVSLNQCVFKQTFTGNGSDTQFQLNNTENATFTDGSSWASAKILNTLPSYITKTNKGAIYDSINIFARNRITVSSINASGLVTLSHVPRDTQQFIIWYWYDLATNDTIDDYYREDFVTTIEGEKPVLIATDITFSESQTVKQAIDDLAGDIHTQNTDTALRTNKLIVLANGDVGIGINPTQKLDVLGNIKLSGNLQTDKIVGYTGNPVIIGDSQYDRLEIAEGSITKTSIAQLNSNVFVMMRNGYYDGTYQSYDNLKHTLMTYDLTSQSDAYFSWYVAQPSTGALSWTELMQLKENGDLWLKEGNLKVDGTGISTFAGNLNVTGNVGIGVTPTQKLDVAGSIKLTGDIKASTYFGIHDGTRDRITIPSNATYLYSPDGSVSLSVFNDSISSMGNFRPNTDNSKSLGISGTRWKDLWLIGSLNDGTNSLTIANAKSAYDHISLTNDPHSVTKAQVGLTNVPNINFQTSLTIDERITHTGDTDTYIKFDANRISLYVGGQREFNILEGLSPNYFISIGSGLMDISFNVLRVFIGGSEGNYYGRMGINNFQPATLLDVAGENEVIRVSDVNNSNNKRVILGAWEDKGGAFELWDSGSVDIKKANTASGGSDSQIEITDATGGVFLIKINKGQTTDILDQATLEIEVETNDSPTKIYTVYQSIINFISQQIDWNTP